MAVFNDFFLPTVLQKHVWPNAVMIFCGTCFFTLKSMGKRSRIGLENQLKEVLNRSEIALGAGKVDCNEEVCFVGKRPVHLEG